MTTTTLTSLKNAQRSLLLKPLDAAVFLAPWGTPLPTSFTDPATSNLLALPSAFQSVGLIDKKTGVAFARGITAAPIESYGELQAVRNDITSDITTFEFEPQQTSAATLSLITGANMANVMAAANGEVFFPQPTNEQITYYSCIIIGKDGNDANPIYVIKQLPKVAVSKYSGDQWTPTDVLAQKLTLVAFKDDNAGFSVAHTYAGAGWKKLLAQTGINYNPGTLSPASTTVTGLSHTATNTPSPAYTLTDVSGSAIPFSSLIFSGLANGVTVQANGLADTSFVFYPGTTAVSTAFSVTATYNPYQGINGSAASPQSATATFSVTVA